MFKSHRNVLQKYKLAKWSCQLWRYEERTNRNIFSIKSCLSFCEPVLQLDAHPASQQPQRWDSWLTLVYS